MGHASEIDKLSILMSVTFATISTIAPKNNNTWADKLFLTFDIDWAHDEVLLDTAELISKSGAAATWFVTHATPVLDDIRALTGQELGIHPNFNALLDGVNDNGHNGKEIVETLLAIVPEAKSVRSHSMTQNSRLLDLFQACGLTHELNHFIPQYAGIELKPWVLWNQLWKIPYFWEDDLHILYNAIDISQKEPAQLAIEGGGLKVFDFHPIHVFLNTESLERYERTRPLHQNPKELIKYRYEGHGTRNRLTELLEAVKK
jgi:hypothetical protein